MFKRLSLCVVRRGTQATAWVVCAFFMCGCATIYNPATEKKELVLIDTPSEASLGKVISKQIELQYPLSKDARAIARLDKIGEKIAEISDRKDLKYYFKVVKDEGLNAFSLPGGFVYVNSGLMDIASDDELACVVGHEIGHIAARHAAKKLQVSLGYQLIMGLALRNATSVELNRAVNTVFNLIALGYSREDERLSDRLAIKYALKSDFKPEGMITFFEKLKEEEKKKGINYHIAFLESHPAIDERINNAKKEIDLQKINQAGQEIQPNKEEKNPSKILKRCPKCGKNYPPEYKFCTKDGANLTQ
ncbi:MAG: M48 family metalloprotease [Candidatus Omnitrophota bacterium]|nr:M48 family metalloprotease [Candidatus Omnitrophota bacterium]